MRDFLAVELAPDMREAIRAGRQLSRDRQTEWQRRLWRRGWIAPGWPAEYGGCDWTAEQRHVFDEECVEHDAPFVNPFGLFRVGPVIWTFGSEDQRKRFLPGILDSSQWWCQGYSEPGAGSDLAALSLNAERKGDFYLLNGTKTWTTQAHLADWMFALVRTGRGMKSRDGISFLLVDMKSPGLTVRQIPIMDGRRHVNEVHFDNVSVPTSQRVGEEGQGWAASTVLLGHERLQIAEVPQTRRLLDRAKELARKRLGDDGRPLIEHAHWATRLVDLEAQWASHAAVHRRFVSEAEGRAPGAEVSMLKVRGSELRQAVNALTMELLGIDALYLEPSQLSQTGHPQALVQEFLYSRASTIYGGSNEIQRNILARKVLGS